jgi:UDP-N-acetylglucosamine transferase subunit ALG13
MIFVTTGTQLAFPRLISAMDGIAPALGERVVAQIGPDPGRYPALDVVTHLTPERFETLVSEARVLVAHAGIGTILTARRHAKPLILMARRHALGEHRNDHQVATLAAISGRTGLYAAADAAELEALLARTDLRPAEDARGEEAARLDSFVASWLTEQD